MTVVSTNKVLHIASGDQWAGAEVQLFTLVKTLHIKNMISVRVVLLNHGTLEQRLQETGVHVVVLDESKLNALQIFFRLKRLIAEQKPDIVHTHRTKENIIGSIAAFLSGNMFSLRTAHGTPEHTPSWRQLPKRLIIALDRFCGRYLQDKIVAVSDDLATILKNDFPADHICIIENGIDLEGTKKHKVKSHTSPKTMESAFKIGFVGRLVPVKRVDLFIQTARYILEHHPNLNVNFHIYGNGPLHSQLKQLSKKLKTEDNVYFEGHHNNISEKLQELDILLMTSDHEGLPMVLLEAMALEIPIVAHAVGGIPKLLDHGICGTLVNEHTAAGYAQEIITAAKNHKHCLDKSIHALQRANSSYTAIQNANKYCTEYISLKGLLLPQT